MDSVVARKIVPEKLELDLDVSAFLSRVGTLNEPNDFVLSYNVERSNGLSTVITVVFIADDEFSKVKRTEAVPDEPATQEVDTPESQDK